MQEATHGLLAAMAAPSGFSEPVLGSLLHPSLAGSQQRRRERKWGEDGQAVGKEGYK